MQLIYLWLEEFRIIKNQEINFSLLYNITFDKKSRGLKIKKLENNILNNFFGENIKNINRIVGKNASGNQLF